MLIVDSVKGAMALAEIEAIAKDLIRAGNLPPAERDAIDRIRHIAAKVIDDVTIGARENGKQVPPRRPPGSDEDPLGR